ncbi:hypothetical protein [Nitrosospira briensis]|uniref:hypothetical protein n=1 Tax=Nitrosospira briensis TaxID=35799 RepID=UPI000469607B|nr:hypothetical protein [Nitrosospira briensis]
MSKKIYNELPEHFIRGMRNWALTNAGVIKERRTISSIYSGIGGDTYGESNVPLLTGEARDIDQALSALPARYKQAVSLFWQYEGWPLTWFARRSGQGVDWRTYEQRVIRGHEMLKAEIARQREKWNNYRETVKNLRQLA